MKTGSEEIVSNLSQLIMNQLSSTEGLFVVHWIEMLLISDPYKTRSALSTETALRIAKNFTLFKRFSGSRRGSMASGGTETLIDEIAKSIISTEYKDHVTCLFTSTTIPKISNKGISEGHVVFWHLVGSELCRQIVPDLLALIHDCDDDDVHCTVLEFFASGVSDVTENEWLSFIRSEIVRGDASLLPTIAAGIRIGLFELKSSSLENRPIKPMTDSVIAEFLIANMSTDTYRFLLVLNNAFLIDLDMISALWDRGVLEKFLNLSQFRESSDSVRDIHAAILGRLCFVLRGETAVQAVVEAELKRIAHQFDEDEKQHTKDTVFILKCLERFVKYSRGLPEWAIGAIPLAVKLVTHVKDEVRDVATSFLALTARFIRDTNILSVVRDANPKEGEIIIGMIANVLINKTKWTDEICSLVDEFENTVKVDELTHPTLLAAYKSSLVDLLVPVSLVDIITYVEGISDYSSRSVVKTCALVTLSSLYYDLPVFGVKAVTRLANALDTNLDSNIRKLSENTLSEFLKTLTDRGTRERIEMKFDSHTKSMIRSGKGKHSYIS
jgi:hypothetical protein